MKDSLRASCRVALAAVSLASAWDVRAEEARARRPMEPEDTYSLQVISALDLSPDGRSLAYVVDAADREDNSYSSTLFLGGLDGSGVRSISRKDTADSTPRFSPDGQRLAYLSDRGEGTQIVVARADGRKPRAVTAAAEGVDGYDWSPDGKWLVFVSSDSAKVEADPVVITGSLIQRDGEGYVDKRRSHLWIVSSDGGAPRQITRGPYDDSDPRWSPDGRQIAFVSNRTQDPDASDNTDIYLVQTDGSEVRKLTTNPGPDESPRWSHTGDRIAFIGSLRENDFYQTNRLMVVPVAGGAPLDLSGSLDTWVALDAFDSDSSSRAAPQWTPDDQTIYTKFERRGANYLAAIPSAGGPVREVLGGAYVLSLVRFSPIAGRFLFTLTDPTHPSELHASALDGTGLTRLSHLNDDWLAARKLSVPEKIVATNSSGDKIESWLYPPVDFSPAQRYPLILYIHGGPQDFDGDYFDSGLENQILPGAGFAVLRVNYRGSTSYGEAFCHALWGDWHTREYEDLMAALDQALTRPWLDPERLGIGGWSYGGIMTIWTVGHTNRFKVGVPERFDVDYLSAFGQDQWFVDYLAELGNPFTDAEKYRRLSPLTYAPNIKTPLYLIADEDDGNCPMAQAMQFYQRLRLLGIKTELVIYPGEPHTMAEPAHLVDRLQRLLAWFGAYLSTGQGTAQAHP